MNEPGIPAPVYLSSASPAPAGALTFGQILDRIFRLMRTHWKVFFGIASVPAAAIFVFTAAVMSFMAQIIRAQLASNLTVPPVLPPYFPLMMLIAESFLMLVYALYLPAAFHAAVQADLGVAVTFRDAYRAAWSRFGSYLWLMVLFSLYLVIPIVVVAGVLGVPIALMYFTERTASTPGFPFFLIPIIVFLYLCIVVYAILITLRFALAFPASIAENLTARAALRRSAQLTRGSRGRIFLVILVVYAAVYVVQLVCILVLGVIASLVALGAVLSHVAVGSHAFFVLVGLGVLGYLLTIIVTALLIYSALTAALAVLYHDLRLRREGTSPAPAA